MGRPGQHPHAQPQRPQLHQQEGVGATWRAHRRSCCGSSTLSRGHTQLRLLQSLCLLATKGRRQRKVALSTFVEMAQAEVLAPGWASGQAGGMLRLRAGRQDACFPPAQKDSVPALLAMAQACSLLKQIPKARTQLGAGKAPWAG